MRSYSNYRQILKYVKNVKKSSSTEVISTVKYSYLKKKKNPSDEHFKGEIDRYMLHRKWIKGDILVKDLLRIRLYPITDWVLELTKHSNEPTLKKGLNNFISLSNFKKLNHYGKINGIYKSLKMGSFDVRLKYVTILQFDTPFIQDGNHRLIAIAKNNLNDKVRCFIGYN